MEASALPVEYGGGHAHARGAGSVLTAGEVAAFLLGLTTWVQVEVLGQLYLGELGLVVCALALPVLFARLRRVEERRLLTWYVLLFGVYLVGLAATDLYRGTPFGDYARGWARGVFLFTNTIGLLAIGYARPRQLVAWVAGQAVSGLLVYAVDYGQYGIFRWKFGLAFPVTVAALLLINSRRTGLATVVLLGLGAVNLLLDFRSLAIFCLAVAVLLYFKSQKQKGRVGRGILATAVFAVLVGAGFLAVYSGGVVLGGQTFGREVVERRGGSNIQRLAGLLIGVQAIRESPLVGYGSWARSSDLFADFALLQEEMDIGVTAAEVRRVWDGSREEDVIPTHSQLLQSWVEAGIPGLVFFLFLFTAILLLLRRLLRAPGTDRLFALVSFWGIWALWSILLSPFSGAMRLRHGVAFALLVIFGFSTVANGAVGNRRAR